MKKEKNSEVDEESYRKLGLKSSEVNAPFIKKIYRHLGISIARVLVNTSITPNQVSYASAIIVILSSYFFFRADYTSLIIAAILLQIGFLFDYVDGSLSRIKNSSSAYGDWLDEMFGTYGFYIFIFVGVTFGVYSQIREPHVLILGLLIPIGLLTQALTHTIYSENFKFAKDFGQEQYRKLGFMMFFRPTLPFMTLLLTLGAIFNKVYWVLVFFGIYSPIYSVIQNTLFTIKARKEFLKERRARRS